MANATGVSKAKETDGKEEEEDVLVRAGGRVRSSPASLQQSSAPQRCERPLITSPDMDFSIRAASLEDCEDIMRMIMELAEYDKLTDHVKITQKDLERDGFSKNPFFHVIIAEVPEPLRSKEGHTKIGYALYFYSYSSWKWTCAARGRR